VRRVFALWVHAVGAHNRRDGLPVFLDERSSVSALQRTSAPAGSSSDADSELLMRSPRVHVVAVPVRDGIAFGTESGIGIGIEIDTESGISHFWARDAFSNE